ncbi:MAG TPA: hypothetical protein VFW87_24075 [Pirellulales bacterium]|nr:hypothetical protein [Pirellulales bacterium]
MVDQTGQHFFVLGPLVRKPEPAPPGHHDPVRVQLTPAKVVAPVGAEVVLLAGVCGPDGYLLARERVEWMLASGGVGEFLAVGRQTPLDWFAGFPTWPRKITNNYAIGSTSSRYLCLTRGTPTPTDDFPVDRGQAWIAVTSPVEGTSYVTAYAPGVNGWDQHRQTSVIHWIDSEFAYPPPTINPVGSRHTLTTIVTRHTTHEPIMGWRVRYEISGGPSAGFSPDGATVIEVPTNESGQASAEIYQLSPQSGSNTISIQVIRPSDAAGGEPFVISNGSTTATWTSPDMPSAAAAPPSSLRVSVTGPAQAQVGDNVTFAVEVTNAGASAVAGVVLVDRYDAGLEHANQPGQGNRVIERELGDFAPGQTRAVDVTLRVLSAGQLCNVVEVHAAGGAHASDQACLTAAGPAAAGAKGTAQLRVTKTGPPRKEAGQEADFTIEVTNTGMAPVANISVTDHFDVALQPQQATEGAVADGSDLTWQLDRLEPGQTSRLKIICRCLEPADNTCNRVVVTTPDGARAEAEACLQVTPAGARLSAAISEERDPVAIDNETTYLIQVRNNGLDAERQVSVSVTLPDLVQPVADGAQGPGVATVRGNSVQFAAVDQFAAGATLEYRVRGRATKAGNGVARVTVNAQGLDEPITAEETTTVVGRP